MQHNYKVGDKLVCIKTLDTWFTAGNIYKVIYCDEWSVSMISDVGRSHNCTVGCFLDNFKPSIKYNRKEKLKRIYVTQL